MQLTIDKQKINFNDKNKMGLSKWEMLFWQNMSNKGVAGNHYIVRQKIRENLQLYLERLMLLITDKNNFIISREDDGQSELNKYFYSLVDMYNKRGDKEMADSLLKNAIQEKELLAEKFGKQQYEDYCRIVEILGKGNYEDSFVCLMLNEFLTKTYRMDYSKGRANLIVKSRELGQNIVGIMNLPKEVIDYIYTNVDIYNDFKSLYFDAQKQIRQQELKMADVNTFGKGYWIKFDSRANDKTNFEDNVVRLKSLVADTPWCTSYRADCDLEYGDFYVFVGNDDCSHLAVKMKGDMIDEVRGIKGGNAQEIEDDYREIVVEFLQKNKEFKNCRNWLEKEEWNNRLVGYNNRINNNCMRDININEMLEDVFKKDYKSNYGLNSNKQILLKHIECNKMLQQIIVDYINEKFDANYKVDQVIFGETIDKNFDFNNKKVVLGNVDLYGFSENISNIFNIERIFGNLSMNFSKFNTWDNLKFVAGNLDMCFANIQSLNVEYIGGDLCMEECCIQSVDKLKEIGGSVFGKYAMIESFGAYTEINGNVDFSYSRIKSLGKLKLVNGIMNVDNAEIEGIPQLK